MRRRWQIVLWIAGAAVVVPAIVLAPPTSEFILHLTCRDTPLTPKCVIRMRAMGDVWAQLGWLDRAIMWYGRAATEGDDAASYFYLGWAYEQRGFRDIVPKAQVHAREQDAAAAEAQAALERRFERQLVLGEVRPGRQAAEAPAVQEVREPNLHEDYDLAEAAYRQAAERNFAPAMNNLGAMYVSGVFGVARRGEGAQWLLRAGQAGNPFGAINLALIYSGGLGVPQDAAEAARWGQWKGERVNPRDLHHPTLERTHMVLGGDAEPRMYAAIREAARRNIPLDASFKPLAADPRLPTFRQVQEELRRAAPH